MFISGILRCIGFGLVLIGFVFLPLGLMGVFGILASIFTFTNWYHSNDWELLYQSILLIAIDLMPLCTALAYSRADRIANNLEEHPLDKAVSNRALWAGVLLVLITSVIAEYSVMVSRPSLEALRYPGAQHVHIGEVQVLILNSGILRSQDAEFNITVECSQVYDFYSNQLPAQGWQQKSTKFSYRYIPVTGDGDVLYLVITCDNLQHLVHLNLKYGFHFPFG